MAADSSSTSTPTVAMGEPSAGIHGQSASTRPPRANTRRARARAAAIAAMLTRPAGRPERRSGLTRARTRKEANGRPRIATAEAVIALALEQAQVIGVDRAPHAEDHDHDGQAEADLGHGDGEREQREDQARDV